MKRFPSVKKNGEFQKIYRGGTSHANRLLVMYVMKNGEESNRIGISVSKKVGNSVVRHHITRLSVSYTHLYRNQKNRFYASWRKRIL